MSKPPLIEEAMRYLAGSLSIIPIGAFKKPCAPLLPTDPGTGKPIWKPFQTQPADETMVQSWFTDARVTGIAAVCGKVSLGLLIIDFDVPRLHEAWKAAVGSLADGLPVQATGKGFQVALRCADPGPNQPLAWVPDEGAESGRSIGIETRGEGGYAVLPGSVHPNGKTYTAIVGDFAAIPVIPMERVQFLLAAARDLCEAPFSRQELERAQRAPMKVRPQSGTVGRSVIGEWNRRVPIRQMLSRAGYIPHGQRFTRPGKDATPGGVFVFDDAGRSFHHSTNDPLHDGHAHDSFSVFCELEHAGDVSAAVKAAAAELGMAKGLPDHSGTTAGVGGSPPSGGSGGVPAEGSPDSWPEPGLLPDALPPVLPFDPDLLPDAFRDWIIDIAERIQCPIDFAAVAAMVALSAIVGRKLGMRPKKHDNWTVAPNLWGGCIGRPGVMKTPAIQEPLKPLTLLEIDAKREFDDKAKEHEAGERVAELKKKEGDKEIRKALKDPAEARRLALESIKDDEASPVRKRYIVNDSTVEKLGEILNENPFGVLAYRDELIGLLKALDKEGQESGRAFYLEAWNGTGRFTYDRIGRGTIDIEAAILSIIGGIQPGPLSQYLRGAAKGGTGDDGLIQRFQLLVWPDISKEWVNVDRWPDTTARKLAHAVFEGLSTFDPILVGADTDPGEPEGIPFLRFDDQAQRVFDAWRSGLEAIVRCGEEHPALESHLSKYRSLIPSLALLIHLADGGHGPVGIAPLTKAMAWGKYLESHARRVYSQAIHPDLAAARVLAKKILAGEVKDGFALRDVYRKGWSGLGSGGDVKGAIDLLIDLDWLAEDKLVTAGRTATLYSINPRLPESEAAKILQTPSRGTDKGDRRGDTDPSGSSVSDAPGPLPDFNGPDREVA